MPATLNLQVNLPDVSFSQIPLPTNELHVSTSGNDTTGNGSTGSPYKTVQKAMIQLANRPADQRAIRVHSGTYRAGAVNTSIAETTVGGSQKNPCWLTAEPGVVLVAPDNQSPGESNVYIRNRPFLSVKHRFWIIDGFELDGGGTHWNAVNITASDHVVLKNLIIHGFTGNNAISFYNAQDIALLGGKIHTSHRWAWVNPGANKFEIRSRDPSAEDCHGVYVNSGCSRIWIKGVESYDNGADSVQCNKESPGAIPSHITIEWNRFHHDFENAVDLKTCEHVAVRGNKVYGYRETVRSVTKRDPRGAAVVVHVNAENILLEKNRFWDCTTAATFGAANGRLGNMVFRRNLIFDASAARAGMPDPFIGFGIYASHVSNQSASRIEIYNNTFYNIPCYAIFVGTNEQDANDIINNVIVANNIVMDAGYGLDGEYALRFKFYQQNSPTGVKNMECDNNLYYNSRNSSRFRIETSPVTPNPYEELIRDSGGFVTTNGARGWGSNNRPYDRNSFIDNPIFINKPRYNDFYTQQGSRARDNATQTPEQSPICGNGPDIGFLESC